MQGREALTGVRGVNFLGAHGHRTSGVQATRSPVTIAPSLLSLRAGIKAAARQ
jgi:hypothetical protein